MAKKARLQRQLHSKSRRTAVSTKKVVSDFSVALCQEADQLAAELKISRSGLIRRAMEELVSVQRRKKLQDQIDAYFEASVDLEREIMDDFKHADADIR
jgi:hypothetical protein